MNAVVLCIDSAPSSDGFPTNPTRRLEPQAPNLDQHWQVYGQLPLFQWRFQSSVRGNSEKSHDMRDLFGEIERAVKARGWSARQASLHAVGTPELIHDMRRGRVPSVERFRTLCQAQELEFHVGSPRDGGRVDAVRLSRAREITERALVSTGRTTSHADKARAVSAVYDLMAKDAHRQARPGSPS